MVFLRGRVTVESGKNIWLRVGIISRWKEVESFLKVEFFSFFLSFFLSFLLNED